MGQVRQIDVQLSLVNAVRNNDERVLKQLYLECFGKIETHILKNNGTRPQAKDTYQEAFIATWQNVKAGKFVPTNETALQGYLYQIARNKWTDFLRSSRYKKTSSLGDNYQIEDLDSGTQINAVINKKEEHISVAMEAFGQLGKECQQLLTHFYFEKRSMRDIAAAFNIGEASARNKKYRCITLLRELALSPK